MGEIKEKPLVSVIVPAYNEEAIVASNLEVISNYMKRLEDKFEWKIIFINDGSKDRTGELAEELSKQNDHIIVVHHIVNLNLGNALKTGFENADGDYIITLDLDLSYAPYHIGDLLQTLVTTGADVVVASPYMKGGKVTAVPFLRRIMSKWVNRFMRITAQEKLYTYTCMVRGYRTEFLKRLNLKTKDYEINPEILYKSMILRGRIIEIPAHLDWTEQNKLGVKRQSGMRLLKTFFSGLMAGFIFRPYIFFIGFGLLLFLIAMYIIIWIFINTLQIMPQIVIDTQFIDDRFSYAIGEIYKSRPHAFIVGGITLMLSVQILSLGFLSLQSKRYFEEIFHIDSSILEQLHSDKMISSVKD